MNSEVFRIRQNKTMDNELYGNPSKIPEDILTKYQYNLNVNMTKIGTVKNDPHTSINVYIENFIQSIYLILEMFTEMNIYPDYFFDIVFKRNIDLKRVASESNVNNFKNNNLDIYSFL